jgi:quinol monooxygenase YgiN
MKMTVDLYAEYSVLPGHESRVLEMMRALTEKVRSEPGNLLFLPYVLNDQPRSWFVLESYVDRDAFAAHLGAEYGTDFNSEIAEHIEGEATTLTFVTPTADLVASL